MWTIRGLFTELARNEDEILAMIEDGSLLYAFDLSLEPKLAKQRALRVLPHCVDDFIAGRSCEFEWPAVARLLVPHDHPILTGLEVQHVCNVSCAHVTALIRRKFLTAVKNGRPGPGGSPRITTESFLRFLQDRRFP
jgi:hypothetical protein